MNAGLRSLLLAVGRLTDQSICDAHGVIGRKTARKSSEGSKDLIDSPILELRYQTGQAKALSRMVSKFVSVSASRAFCLDRVHGFGCKDRCAAFAQAARSSLTFAHTAAHKCRPQNRLIRRRCTSKQVFKQVFEGCRYALGKYGPG